MTYSRGQYDDGYGRDRRLAVMRLNMASVVREAGQAVIRVHPSATPATLRTIGTKVALRAHNPVQTGSGVTMHSRHADARAGWQVRFRS